jgi:hypothetical protein
VDVGENTAGSDGDAAEELVELFVVADGELKVAGGDAGLLVVAGGVAGEFEDLGAEVLEHSSEVHGGTTASAGGVAAKLQVASDTADGELKSGLGGPAGGFASFLAAASLSFSGHGIECKCEREKHLQPSGIAPGRSQSKSSIAGQKIEISLANQRLLIPIFWPASPPITIVDPGLMSSHFILHHG